MMDEKYKRLKYLATQMYQKAQYLTTDASGLYKAMGEFYRFINFEEKNYG